MSCLKEMLEHLTEGRELHRRFHSLWTNNVKCLSACDTTEILQCFIILRSSAGVWMLTWFPLWPRLQTHGVSSWPTSERTCNCPFDFLLWS